MAVGWEILGGGRQGTEGCLGADSSAAAERAKGKTKEEIHSAGVQTCV